MPLKVIETYKNNNLIFLTMYNIYIMKILNYGECTYS